MGPGGVAGRDGVHLRRVDVVALLVDQNRCLSGEFSATAACSALSPAALRAIDVYPLTSTTWVCVHTVGTATASATVAHSHNSAVSANRTKWSYLATRRGRDSAILVIILLTRFSALRELW